MHVYIILAANDKFTSPLLLFHIIQICERQYLQFVDMITIYEYKYPYLDVVN